MERSLALENFAISFSHTYDIKKLNYSTIFDAYFEFIEIQKIKNIIYHFLNDLSKHYNDTEKFYEDAFYKLENGEWRLHEHCREQDSYYTHYCVSIIEKLTDAYKKIDLKYERSLEDFSPEDVQSKILEYSYTDILKNEFYNYSFFKEVLSIIYKDDFNEQLIDVSEDIFNCKIPI